MSVIVPAGEGGGRSAAAAARHVGWWLLLALALFAGAFLRVWQLRGQMLIDDEWHAVRMLLRSGYADIATHFGVADHSIPLTLFYRWLHDLGVLDEWRMHLPLLAAGIALLAVASLALRREIGAATRASWVALLAVSPTLVYFSRTARPYALVALCGFVALLAFRNWWLRRPHARAWGAIYVACTVLAGWAHLLSLLFTLWPFVPCAIAALRARRAGMARLVGLAVITVLPLALLLGPPLAGDWAAMAGKAGTDLPSWQTLADALGMQFGVGPMLVAACLLVPLTLGIASLWRRAPDIVQVPLGAALFGLLMIGLARPAWIQHAPVLVRYAAPFLPFLLLFLAEGIAVLCTRAGRFAPALAPVAAFAVLAGLVIAGPLPSLAYRPNQFMEHARFQFAYDPARNPYVTEVELGTISSFYRELAKRPPGSVTLIEAPQRAHSNYMPQPWLQAIHRQNVKFALIGSVCGDGEWDELPSRDAAMLRFRRVGRLADILDGASWGADHLVLHMQPWTIPPGGAFPWPVAWPDMEACAARVARRLGPPVHADERIRVFDLRARPGR